MRDGALIAWLCIMRHEFAHDHPFTVPNVISGALVARGWIRHDSEPDWDGLHESWITDEGNTVCDLNGAEWGIDTVPEDAAT